MEIWIELNNLHIVLFENLSWFEGRIHNIACIYLPESMTIFSWDKTLNAKLYVSYSTLKSQGGKVFRVFGACQILPSLLPAGTFQLRGNPAKDTCIYKIQLSIYEN